MNISENHEYWMQMALSEAELGWGTTVPNPMVGAVIVKDGRLLSRAHHIRAGEGHAEVNAIAALSRPEDARGATIYVTLEPCTTFGRTPPCCDAIISCGFARVVIGCLDDNPKHRGAAIQRLQQAGIEVVTGILEHDCRRLNEPFFWWITTGRPWVTLKMAMSLDGKIALADGSSKWITGPAARSYVQKLRRRSQLIMVGGRTALLDDPGLVVTEPPEWPLQPRCAVWSSKSLPPRLKIASRAQVVKPATREEWLEYLSAESRDHGVQYMLMEGGGELAGNALECGIVNQVDFFIAPKIIGGRDNAPAVGGRGVHDLSSALHLREVQVRFFGEDLLYSGII